MSFRVENCLLKDLPGISAEQASQLQIVGLQTNQDLVRLARSPQQLHNLARRLNIPLRYVQKWTALASLSQLPSVGCQYCGLLLHSGIVSTNQLSAIAPGRLYSQIRKLHTQTLRRSDLCPPPDLVVRWVEEAKRKQLQSS